MGHIKKFINGELFIRICLWGLFFAGLAFTVLNGISVIGVTALVGTLLMAIDFPKNEKRDR